MEIVSQPQPICIECIEGYYLDTETGKCVATCSSSQFEEFLPRRKCYKCDEECFSCYGAANNYCTICKNEKYNLNGSCVEKCPDDGSSLQLDKPSKICQQSCQANGTAYLYKVKRIIDIQFKDRDLKFNQAYIAEVSYKNNSKELCMLLI